jgi:hypothetical protein
MSFRFIKREACEELCKKRIVIEEMLGMKPADLTKCVKICRSIASKH